MSPCIQLCLTRCREGFDRIPMVQSGSKNSHIFMSHKLPELCQFLDCQFLVANFPFFARLYAKWRPLYSLPKSNVMPKLSFRFQRNHTNYLVYRKNSSSITKFNANSNCFTSQKISVVILRFIFYQYFLSCKPMNDF